MANPRPSADKQLRLLLRATEKGLACFDPFLVLQLEAAAAIPERVVSAAHAEKSQVLSDARGAPAPPAEARIERAHDVLKLSARLLSDQTSLLACFLCVHPQDKPDIRRVSKDALHDDEDDAVLIRFKQYLLVRQSPNNASAEPDIEGKDVRKKKQAQRKNNLKALQEKQRINREDAASFGTGDGASHRDRKRNEAFLQQAGAKAGAGRPAAETSLPRTASVLSADAELARASFDDPATSPFPSRHVASPAAAIPKHPCGPLDAFLPERERDRAEAAAAVLVDGQTGVGGATVVRQAVVSFYCYRLANVNTLTSHAVPDHLRVVRAFERSSARESVGGPDHVALSVMQNAGLASVRLVEADKARDARCFLGVSAAGHHQQHHHQQQGPPARGASPTEFFPVSPLTPALRASPGSAPVSRPSRQASSPSPVDRRPDCTQSSPVDRRPNCTQSSPVDRRPDCTQSSPVDRRPDCTQSSPVDRRPDCTQSSPVCVSSPETFSGMPRRAGPKPGGRTFAGTPPSTSSSAQQGIESSPGGGCTPASAPSAETRRVEEAAAGCKANDAPESSATASPPSTPSGRLEAAADELPAAGKGSDGAQLSPATNSPTSLSSAGNRAGLGGASAAENARGTTEVKRCNYVGDGTTAAEAKTTGDETAAAEEKATGEDSDGARGKRRYHAGDETTASEGKATGTDWNGSKDVRRHYAGDETRAAEGKATGDDWDGGKRTSTGHGEHHEEGVADRSPDGGEEDPAASPVFPKRWTPWASGDRTSPTTGDDHQLVAARPVKGVHDVRNGSVAVAAAWLLPVLAFACELGGGEKVSRAARRLTLRGQTDSGQLPAEAARGFCHALGLFGKASCTFVVEKRRGNYQSTAVLSVAPNRDSDDSEPPSHPRKSKSAKRKSPSFSPSAGALTPTALHASFQSAPCSLPDSFPAPVQLVDQGFITELDIEVWVSRGVHLSVGQKAAQAALSCLEKALPQASPKLFLSKEDNVESNTIGIVITMRSSTGGYWCTWSFGGRGTKCEQTGERAATSLVSEYSKGGCVSDYLQEHVAFLMASCPPGSCSRVRVNLPLSPNLTTAMAVFKKTCPDACFNVVYAGKKPSAILECTV
ncbi:hypothetical protein DIPPA_30694 [Diplonema papillatum]|nr:hypothetical protein DIPPA_30694 [Diplonema papillatum]